MIIFFRDNGDCTMLAYYKPDNHTLKIIKYLTKWMFTKLLLDMKILSRGKYSNNHMPGVNRTSSYVPHKYSVISRLLSTCLATFSLVQN